MVCQAYDFVELSRRVGCRVQMGGSDQWGNIVNGVDLGRRMGTPQLFALTTPLLTTASGAKMGKTAQRRRLAQRRPVQPLRFLAILAQCRRCRRRQVSQAVHDPADRRDRAARSAARRRDQRSQEGAGGCSDHAAARRARPPILPRKPRGRPSRKARSTENLPTVEIAACRNRSRRTACWRCSSRRAGGLERRGAAPDQGRRPAGQRCRRHRREDGADAGRPHGGRRDQTVAWQKAPRPAQDLHRRIRF